ncbi:helix-turn-helix transcriptional regulator [Streptomyces lasiicapitis]|uniref:helix-turn-helix transcriptional regulator n=1 Tax=Streptomyces lasiicapitis TaxID=1923961 RepID=UPI003679B0A5
MSARVSPSPDSPASRSAVTGDRAFLGVKETAVYLGISPRTLYVWRHRRQGPPSFRMGARGRVTYRIDALDAWIREQELADSRSNLALDPVSAAPQRRVDRSATV